MLKALFTHSSLFHFLTAQPEERCSGESKPQPPSAPPPNPSPSSPTHLIQPHNVRLTHTPPHAGETSSPSSGRTPPSAAKTSRAAGTRPSPSPPNPNPRPHRPSFRSATADSDAASSRQTAIAGSARRPRSSADPPPAKRSSAMGNGGEIQIRDIRCLQILSDPLLFVRREPAPEAERIRGERMMDGRGDCNGEGLRMGPAR